MHSQLAVYSAQQPSAPPVILEGDATLAEKLGQHGVRYERWPTRPHSDAPLQDYQAEIDRLTAEQGFTTVDVVSLQPDHPQRREFRQKFLAEHSHSDHEVRFFVAGSGLFFLHSGDEVLRILCTAGDLISVPADMQHWFDMGEQPDFTAIRLFTDPDGWVAEFTHSGIDQHFPYYGDASRPAKLLA